MSEIDIIFVLMFLMMVSNWVVLYMLSEKIHQRIDHLTFDIQDLEMLIDELIARSDKEME